MNVSTSARVVAILAEARLFATARGRSRTEQMVECSTRLGGMFAWSVEQGRFAREMMKPETASACEGGRFRVPRPPVVPGVKVLRSLASSDAGVASYQATGRSGEPLRVLTSMSSEPRRLAADTRIAGILQGLIPDRYVPAPRADVVRMLDDVALIATLDSDLDQEADGLQLAAKSNTFGSPRVVFHRRDVLVLTEASGTSVEELPAPERAAVYDTAVADWARTLLEDRILIVSLRRDRLLAHDGQLCLSRWSGAHEPSADALALLRNLMAAAFSTAESTRQEAGDHAAQIVADGLGVEGSLDAIKIPILALLSNQDQVLPSRKIVLQIVGRQSSKYSQHSRVEMLQLLRQLVWLRDLAAASGVSDLTRPWRQLALDLGC